MIRVAHYLNQFFARVGGEEKADVPLAVINGPIGPGVALEKELKGFMAARLPDYMCPILYCFVDDLPRTPTGKVQRFKLKR